ncbi:hypothetical protein NOM01_13250 [Sporolactobacillus sp. STSJ-5]|uniref:hypothetical protein n=1 Tax=Sporolactobacillus sp. STSJ-5 TaxID=2965076 RepID=UPI0021023AB4|nr:hypothetical protein [Sporolactobacillus sp. STSJ-5]MCQ2010976.1 hypothetical protein [Sporolactobacillus sp. STSJ-5]
MRASSLLTKQESEYALYVGKKKITIPANVTANVSPLTEQSGTLATRFPMEKNTKQTRKRNFIIRMKQWTATLPSMLKSWKQI